MYIIVYGSEINAKVARGTRKWDHEWMDEWL